MTDFSADPAEVRAAARGDRAAFARLHARYHPVVHAVLLARLSAEDAEDLVQEVFVSAWLRLPELHEPQAFGGWLCAIARHRAVDHWRRRAGERRSGREAPDPVAPVPTIEVREALDAVQALPEAYRETLLMRLVEGLSGPEIAAATGLTEGSVRVNLHRGMMLLRDRLSGRAP